MSKGITKHGCYAEDPVLYSRWNTMMARCYRPSARSFERYGGRGIVVCPQWHEPRAFFNWAQANGYSPRLTIDRSNSDGDYKPSNCRWVTPKEQARNRANNRLITYQARTMCMVEWAEETGIPFTVLKARFKRGWASELALTRPIGRWIGN